MLYAHCTMSRQGLIYVIILNIIYCQRIKSANMQVKEHDRFYELINDFLRFHDVNGDFYSIFVSVVILEILF